MKISRNALTAISLLLLSLGWSWEARCQTTPADHANPNGKVGASPQDSIDFNRDIRPLLSNSCFPCHGPDAATRKARLRLDLERDAKALRTDYRVVDPGNSEDSELFLRISAADPRDRMPPPESENELSSEEIDRIRRWIDEGATWDRHWSFSTPRRPPFPATESTRSRNAIDAFVARRLKEKGLSFSPEADPATLLRRVTLDLTGLPPTPGELQEFLSSSPETRLEEVVERLLESPRFGEHMAVPWLDAGRYADTHGYHYDNERNMWRWRQWVIEAYNRNLPFDDFTVEQLAGDLLPDADRDQQIATGFNRNHGINWEGGIIPEEYRLEYVMDRADTTATVWMGLTLACARCHDHKFDPISQEDYYSFAAFFNQVPEKGQDGEEGNAEPTILCPDPDVERKLASLRHQIDQQSQSLSALGKRVDLNQDAWEERIRVRRKERWTLLQPFSFHSTANSVLTDLGDGTLLASGPHPENETYEIVGFSPASRISALRLETLPHESFPDGGPGRAFHANFLLSEFTAEVAPIQSPEKVHRVRFVAAHADFSQENFDINNTVDGNDKTGWAVDKGGKGVGHEAIFVPERPFGFPGGTAIRIRIAQESEYQKHSIGRIRLSYATEDVERFQPSPSSSWSIIGPFLAEDARRAYRTAFFPEESPAEKSQIPNALAEKHSWRSGERFVDGVVHELEGKNAATYLYRTVTCSETRAVTLSLGSDDGFKLWVNGDLVLTSDVPRGATPDQDQIQVDLHAGVNSILLKVVNYGGPYQFSFRRYPDHGLEVSPNVARALEVPSGERDAAVASSIRDAMRSQASKPYRDGIRNLRRLEKMREEIEAEVPTTMVMRDREEPRETFVLMRGRYDKPGSPVTARAPGVFPVPEEEIPPNRLGLARWLVSGDHPLTARVAVNRFWLQLFGRGLVETTSDFGSQGSPPSHPELLDWLSCEFVESGWDVKSLLRLIVTSTTYRQSSRLTPDLLEEDPENRWLARGPRFRLSAETIRDAALFVSQLLVERIGGASVKPYQPPGLWKEVGSDFNAFSANTYVQDQGEGLYRRSLYTFYKRTVPPPTLSIFDAPTREKCISRRSRTNTPLQALALLNDTTYVEASRALAQRVLLEARDGDANRWISRLFLTVLTRSPRPEEHEVLHSLYREQLEQYRQKDQEAQKLLQVGHFGHRLDLETSKLAALTVIASVILNLDETITKR